MRFTAFAEREPDETCVPLLNREFYSVGGGFVLDENEIGQDVIVPDATPVRFPFKSGAELLERCRESGLPISGVMMANELSWRTEAEVRDGLLHIWSVMEECIHNGLYTEGIRPGPLRVRRRAPELVRRLAVEVDSGDPLRGMDWITLYALAVNEENAAGGRVVTAPTNGAAGIVPAVLKYLSLIHI